MTAEQLAASIIDEIATLSTSETPLTDKVKDVILLACQKTLLKQPNLDGYLLNYAALVQSLNDLSVFVAINVRSNN